MLLLTVSLDVHTSVRRIAMFVGVAEASAATATAAAAAAAAVNACFLWPWGHSFVAFSACDNVFNKKSTMYLETLGRLSLEIDLLFL